MAYSDATLPEIEKAVAQASRAFIPYKNTSPQCRRDFLHALADDLQNQASDLVDTAVRETNLGVDRLKGELNRTCGQLRSYSDAALAGRHLDLRIDTADPLRKPAPRPDIRKMMVALGPVVVFGSSNFPFAYSTAGGDTAGALAAGCPVIVKAHPAHAATSEKVAQIIVTAIIKAGLPEGTFAHLHGASFETGKALVTHPHIAAVGFTGSTTGGKALFDWANQRKEPIPVFSEMGSINPVFFLPGKLKTSAKDMARDYAASITLGAGQFCTNPGLLIGIEGHDLDVFVSELGRLLSLIPGAKMLHPGIAKAYIQKRETALAQSGVTTEAVNQVEGQGEGIPTLAMAKAKTFLANPVLHQEVFGPYSLMIACSGIEEMEEIAHHLEGQLTSTLMATEEDFTGHLTLVEAVQQHCGRLILNGVPTGVEVVAAMQHGGPYPATTDSRFTSVGEDSIRRFTRPVSFQNFPDHLLPEALQEANSMGYWRLVNGEWKK